MYRLDPFFKFFKILHRDRFYQMEQDFGPFQVTEELDPQSLPLAGALDKTRDISQHEISITGQLHNPQLGFQCREWIISDFWTGMGGTSKQCRFPRVGKSYDAHIGQ